VFNGYANFLCKLTIIKYIEYYLLVASILHVVVAVYRAFKTKVRVCAVHTPDNTCMTIRSQMLLNQVLKGVTRTPMTVLKRLYLLASGIVILSFVVIHLRHFHFNENNPLTNGVEDGLQSSVDFYSMMLEVFADDLTALGYVVAILAVGVHLFKGWGKAVHKMNFDKEHGSARFLHPVRTLGQWCAALVTVGFIACICGARYVLWQQREVR